MNEAQLLIIQGLELYQQWVLKGLCSRALLCRPQDLRAEAAVVTVAA